MIPELIHVRTDDTLRYRESDLPSGLYRVLIPSGTHVWYVGINTYLSDEPASALVSFDKPPAEPAEEAGADTRNVLERLWQGSTLSFYGPPGAGALTMSQPERTSSFRADRDRWLYLDFKFPAGRALAISSIIELHPSTDTGTDTGTSQPAVDPALYARTQELVVRVGLVQSMYRLSGCTNNSDFEKKAIESGVWPGLIEMVRLAGEKQ